MYVLVLSGPVIVIGARAKEKNQTIKTGTNTLKKKLKIQYVSWVRQLSI